MTKLKTYAAKLQRMEIPIPAGVARTAHKGLVLHEDYQRGGTAVGVNTALNLVQRNSLPLAKVLHIANYFPRHAGDNLEQKNPPSNGYIAWLLWGGDPGRRWAEMHKKRYLRELEKFRG